MSLFERAELAPADPILGLTEAFNADPRQEKVNLGVGVYLDETGGVPLMEAVRLAQGRYIQAGRPHGYLPIDGLPAFRTQVRSLAFGDDPVLDRTVTVGSLGGTGALKLGADFLKQVHPSASVLISGPSWENHRALFTRAGFAVHTYPYYDEAARGIDFAGMLDALRAAAPGTIVILHPCCHNPTGYDLTDEQWDQVVDVAAAGGLFPFLDMAYQGFAASIVEDRAVVGKFVQAGVCFFLGTSYSKTFGLYGQRTGALHAVTAGPDEARRVLSQLKVCARTNYSSPSAFGAEVVAAVLADPELRLVWERELTHMRERIALLRARLVSDIENRGLTDMGFIANQRGMFSYSGLDQRQMVRLRQEFGIYGTDAGRLCVAALNDHNVSHVATAIASVRLT